MVSGLSDTSSSFNASHGQDAEKISDWLDRPDQVSDFHRMLLGWFEEHGRDLPWRNTLDPYAILVSEFMLQQTQVTTVLGYYARWMEIFPDVASLAAASEQEVLSVWQGLGYYSRARNVHRLAKSLVADHGGQLPKSMSALRALPGVGEYTAAAVAAFAWDEATPVVDANIARVIARLFDWRDRIDTASGRNFLRETSVTLQKNFAGGRRFNSAIMELGALICRAGQPDCLHCPVHTFCTTSVPAALPVKAPRATTEFRVERVACIIEDEMVYLTQAKGTKWRGLWHLPEVISPQGIPIFSHEYPITKYRVRMDVFHLAHSTDESLHGFEIDRLNDIPIPAPHRRAIMAVLEHLRA